VQDAIRLAEAQRAQDDALQLQRGGQDAPRSGPDTPAIFCEVMAKITVYSTEPCSFCIRAKELLKLRQLDFDEINLAKDPAGRMELVEKTGMLSFPQIVVGDIIVGGFQQLVQADRDGRLAELTTKAA
jgi:glutaredoxin 3